MNHLSQLLALLVVGVALSAVAWRWIAAGNTHEAYCPCEGCRRRACDRYIDQLISDRQRRDEEAVLRG